MNLGEWQKSAQIKLKNSGTKSWQIDSLILIEFVTNLSRAQVLARPDKALTNTQLTLLNKLLNRRTKREPIAYIVGSKEFYKRSFVVNKDVLIPRPESESFIELLIKHKITHQNTVDVGCGSGILGITTKLELPTTNVTLLDNDAKALNMAWKNANKLGAVCDFIISDLLPQYSQYSLILANLPYVPKDMLLQPELDFEPPQALFANDSGMSLYKRLWAQIGLTKSCNYVLTESLNSQHQQMINLAKEAGFELYDSNGLIQFFKKIKLFPN